MTFKEDTRRLLFKMQEEERWRHPKEAAQWWIDMGLRKEAASSIQTLSPILKTAPWMAGVFYHLKQGKKNEKDN